MNAERLRDLLSYDRATGEFLWLVDRGRLAKAGGIAGSVDDGGYRWIRIDGRLYPAQRLAWLHVNGSWPLGVVDHWNRRPSDNRWSNLRDCPQRLNLANSTARRSASGMKGAHVTRNGRFRADISIQGKQRYLGIFDTVDEAHAAYMKAARVAFGDFACGGEPCT